MKLHFAFTIFVLLIPVFADQKEDSKPSEPTELSVECNEIREKLNKNMNLLQNVANLAQGIQQKDCSSVKNSVNLAKKYGKCLPNGDQYGIENIYKNMRFVSKIICENVNKRFLGCFSPENLKQFNECTNKTIQYMDFMIKHESNAKVASLDSKRQPQIRKKRFVKDLLQSLGHGLRSRIDGDYQLPGLSIISSLTENFSSRLSNLNTKKGKIKNMTSLEQQCCMAHLHSDCFLSKVLHTCAEKSELRLYKAFQTIFSLAVRDVVEIACGRIESLEKCEEFSNNYDVDKDLGF